MSLQKKIDEFQFKVRYGAPEINNQTKDLLIELSDLILESQAPPIEHQKPIISTRDE